MYWEEDALARWALVPLSPHAAISHAHPTRTGRRGARSRYALNSVCTTARIEPLAGPNRAQRTPVRTPCAGRLRVAHAQLSLLAPALGHHLRALACCPRCVLQTSTCPSQFAISRLLHPRRRVRRSRGARCGAAPPNSDLGAALSTRALQAFTATTPPRPALARGRRRTSFRKTIWDERPARRTSGQLWAVSQPAP